MGLVCGAGSGFGLVSHDGFRLTGNEAVGWRGVIGGQSNLCYPDKRLLSIQDLDIVRPPATGGDAGVMSLYQLCQRPPPPIETSSGIVTA